MDIRPVPTTLLAAVLPCALACLACGLEDTVTFRFRPDEGAIYEERIEDSILERTGPTYSEIYRQIATRVQVERPDSQSWEFVMSPTHLELGRAGGRDSTEARRVIDAFLESRIVVEVSNDGTLQGVRGVQPMTRPIVRSLRPETAGLLQDRPDPELAETMATAAAERSGSVASLAGRKAAPGDSWTVDAVLPLSSGTLVPITQETIFEGWEPCGARRCVRLRVSNQGEIDSEETMRDRPRLAISITGDGERLIDPDTLHVHRETSTNVLSFEMEFSRTGRVVAWIEEHRRSMVSRPAGTS